MQDVISITFQNEQVMVETIALNDDIRFKVNFDHPIYLLKDIDEDGTQKWKEEGAGETLRAAELGELIEAHTDF
jgi:hypothetical protein